ncbi:hypothetical protein [Tuwongella immobilis]|uniref:Uncharacterized protein n=1 Tax=Tuwongella immobilis TaxID=692036 RepID=A0A6C2YQ96_9BACT|nr:hypothetical protein [Tuwongella immobilis]VIP03062.1 unnamed protein product [Tuwongella immobilis]VTS03273.1 unnamed protein product [Tuwongella immobilis]
MAYTLTEVSRKEVITPEGMTIEKKMLCKPGSARFEAYSALTGTVRLVAGRIIRVPPARDPRAPWCRVAEVKMDPIEESYPETPGTLTPLQRAADYFADPVSLTVIYRTPEQTEEEDQAQGDSPQEIDLASMTWEFSGQNITLPNNRYGWENAVDTQPPAELLQRSDVAVTKLIPRIELVMVRHRCRTKPLNGILAMLGRINSTTIRLAGDTYPAETVRFDAATATRKISNFGFRFFELTYKFAVHPTYDDMGKPGIPSPGNPNPPPVTSKGFVGWNRLFDPRTGFWRRVQLMKNKDRSIHLLDKDVQQTLGGKTVRGFNLLFHPRAI